MISLTAPVSQALNLICLKTRRDSTSHSAYAATETESNGAKIDGLFQPNFL